MVLYLIVKMDRRHLLASSDRCRIDCIRRRRRRRLRRERREWVQKWLLDRGYYGISESDEDTVERHYFPRIYANDTEAFQQLLDMITPLIQKQDTMMREAISPYKTVA